MTEPRAAAAPAGEAAAFEVEFDSAIARHRHRIWLAPGEEQTRIGVPARVDRLAFDVARAQWRDPRVAPRRGRFYPKHVLRDVEAPGGMFRVVGVDAQRIRLDFNHPLAYVTPRAGVRARATGGAAARGRKEQLLHGAGMEAPLDAAPIDFDEPDGFTCREALDDATFYQVPRRLIHVDATCAARIQALYDEWLPAGAEVLDLMAGWRSHLPERCASVTGLGMNAEELADNPVLDRAVVWDLNARPFLPFPDACFDAVVNTVSIEYLRDPAAVLAEVRRVLRPGGTLAVVCSTRYFPGKAMRLWTVLHPMERLAWLLQQVRAAGFQNLETHVEMGLARDLSDHYAAELAEMDPLFAVRAVYTVWDTATPSSRDGRL